MKHYCVTGGMGAGKSYVCEIMRRRGVGVYDCDEGAKRLTANDPEVIASVKRLVGKEAYLPDGTYNRPAVAKFLLASDENKQALNAVIHPAVMRDFYASGLAWMESAILYEARLEAWVDRVVAVVAPEEVRIRRIMERDGLTSDKARAWVERQTGQSEVALRADFTIVNDGAADVEAQVERMLRDISRADWHKQRTINGIDNK